MARYVLLLLFSVMMFSRILGLDFGIAPGLSPKNALLYLSVGLLVLESAIARNRDIELLSVFLPFALMIVYAVLTWLVILLLLDYPYYRAGATLISLKVKLVDQFLMLLVFFYGVSKLSDALWLAKALLCVVAIGNLVTVVDAWNIPDLGLIEERQDGRVSGVMNGSNEYGALLGFFLPATLALYWSERGLKRALAVFAVLLVAVGLLLSASRGAWVGVVVGAVLSAIYLRRYIPVSTVMRAGFLALMLCVVAVALMFATGYGYLLEDRMLQGLGTGDRSMVSSGRTDLWLATLHEMADSPLTFLTGFGWDAYYQTVGFRHASESMYLEYLYNLGAIGVALFILKAVNVVSVARRGLAGADLQSMPFLMGLIFGTASLMVAMVFNDLVFPALYTWAFTGVVLRIAILSGAGRSSVA